MSSGEANKKKRPHTAADIQELEDKLGQILRKLQDLRQSLQSGPVHESQLMSGTLAMHLGEALLAANKLESDHKQQVIDHDIRSTRAAVKAAKSGRNQKR